MSSTRQTTVYWLPRPVISVSEKKIERREGSGRNCFQRFLCLVFHGFHEMNTTIVKQLLNSFVVTLTFHFTFNDLLSGIDYLSKEIVNLYNSLGRTDSRSRFVVYRFPGCFDN